MLRKDQGLQPGDGRPVLADPFYYLKNFRMVLTSLENRYGDLFTENEGQFIRQFAQLPERSCALLVRMIMRRGMFFRSSRLRYPEIGDTAAAAAPLLETGWLEEPDLEVEELHRLLTKAELVDHLALSPYLRRLNKADLLDVLRAMHMGPRSFHDWGMHLKDRVFRPVVKPLAEQFRVMFFGNFHQDWTEFVLSDLGINTYETVSVRSGPFRTRAHIDAFHRMYRCQQQLDAGQPPGPVMANVPPPIADSGWLEEHRQRILFQVARTYERLNDASTALKIFSSCQHRGSRIRTVRLLERRQECHTARELCLAATLKPESEAERQFARRALSRLNRKLNVIDEEAPKGPDVASFEILLDAPSDGRTLEFHVRDQLAQQDDTHCSIHYVENGLINSLFGLLCWDAIFAPIPGVFFHDFQYGPADLESPYFYERRRDRFEECFAALASGRYKAIIRERFVVKAGIQAPFIAWGLLDRSLLECALECFPTAHLQLWFDWIVRDVVENRTGFPDLVQFWPGERRYRMLEIKGPKDRLRDNQRRFLEFCARHQIPVFVCNVRWAGGRPH